MSSVASELALLLEFYTNSFTVAYCSVAGLVLVLYDYLLTFRDEVEHVWQQPWSKGKVLFIINRYLVPLDLCVELSVYISPTVSTSFCRHWFYVDLLLGCISMGVVQAILVLRTYVLWEKSRHITVILGLTYCTSMAIIIAFLVRASVKLSVLDKPISFIFGCVYEESNSDTIGIWSAPLGFETIILMLTIVRGIKHYREKQLKKASVLTTLYRDGLIYFIVIFGMTFVNLVIWLTLPLQLSGMLIMIYRAMTSVLASRLVLNVRGAVDSQRTGQRHIELGSGITNSKNYSAPYFPYISQASTLVEHEPALYILEPADLNKPLPPNPPIDALSPD